MVVLVLEKALRQGATGYTSFRVRSTADCPDVSGWKWQYADTASSWSNADKWFRISCAD